MAEYSDLEIGLERWSDGYSVDLRLVLPGSDADVRSKLEGLQIATEELRQLSNDIPAYGRRLGQDLFAVPDMRDVIAKARAQEGQLRVRLFIDRNAQELNGLRWEALTDPEAPASGAPLLMGERVVFSRYVSSPDWRRVLPRAKGDLKALVVVANPGNLSDYVPGGQPLAPIDVAGELGRARAGLSGIEMTTLGEGDRASLKNIVDRLLSGPDILYLVCHGALIEGQPQLWLEDDAGKVAVTAGTELVTRLRELEQPPRLVVLISCRSAGGEDDALGAFGPKLGEAGIPAILAMHGDVTMATVEAFMPVFFRELQRDGQIDRAVAVARGAVRERPDAWSPVLYMRLKSGRLWYTPGFTSDQSGPDFAKWPALLNHIQAGTCTPILGPGLAESLIGSRRETALRWAETYHFPLSPHDRDDMPQVAQFIAVNQDPTLLFGELGKYFRRGLLSRLGGDAPAELQNAPTDTLVVEVGKRRWDSDKDEPHRALAEQPFPLFVTTALDSLLTEALRSVGKEPRVELFRWNDFADWPPPIKESEPDYYPSAEKPLVYHLFGHFGVADSMVITEDDYFDFLIGATRNNDLIPPAVRRALADSALLFLGFEMEGWDFRVLFRSIMSQQGRARRKRYAHAGVQIDPEEGRFVEIEGARKYLESYFEYSDIHIYWGSTADFARDLRRQREQTR
jgi:CHAT domain/SIR2-like domain